MLLGATLVSAFLQVGAAFGRVQLLQVVSRGALVLRHSSWIPFRLVTVLGRLLFRNRKMGCPPQIDLAGVQELSNRLLSSVEAAKDAQLSSSWPIACRAVATPRSSQGSIWTLREEEVLNFFVDV